MQGSRGRQHQEQRRPAGLKASNQGGRSGEPVPSLRAVAVLSFSKKDFYKSCSSGDQDPSQILQNKSTSLVGH